MGTLRNIEDDRGAVKVEPLLMTVDDSATLTGLSVWTVRQMAYKGRVASVKLGRRLMIPVAELRRVILESTRPRADGLGVGEPSAPKTRRPSVRSTEGEAHVSA